jgi:hypothetical protein
MVLLPRIHSSVVVEFVPTIGHGILTCPELLREFYVTLRELFDPLLVVSTVVLHEDRVEHLPEAVEQDQVHENIDQMFVHIRHISDKESSIFLEVTKI